MVGHTSLWMFFIYGSASFLLEPVHNKIRPLPLPLRGVIWTALIFGIEFAAGLVLKLFGITAWHYDNRFSVLGLIRLDYAPAWFAVGLIFERVHDLLLRHEIGTNLLPRLRNFVSSHRRKPPTPDS